MINNTNKIVTQNINNVEGILMEFMQEIVRKEEGKRLNVDSLETLIGSTIAEFTKTIISMSGLALSNINSNNDINTKDKHCECGKN